MNYENEILTLFLGLGTLIFVVSNFSRLRRLRHAFLFLTGFVLLLPGWTATLFDQSASWGDAFNTIEHLSYAGAVCVLAVWTIRIAYPREGRNS